MAMMKYKLCYASPESALQTQYDQHTQTHACFIKHYVFDSDFALQNLVRDTVY